MKKLVMFALALLALAAQPLTWHDSAHGKGSVDQLLVSNPSWPDARIVILDEEQALSPFSPWDDAFMGAQLVHQPDVTSRRYEAWLYVEATNDIRAADWHGLRPDPDGFRLIYHVDYYPDLNGDTPGFLLLRTEQRTLTLNNSTIIRPTGWYEATPAWEGLIASLEKLISPPSTGDAGLVWSRF